MVGREEKEIKKKHSPSNCGGRCTVVGDKGVIGEVSPAPRVAVGHVIGLFWVVSFAEWFAVWTFIGEVPSSNLGRVGLFLMKLRMGK